MYTITVIILGISPWIQMIDSMCQKGKYLHTPKSGPDVCLLCEESTYMPDERHANRECLNCSFIVDPSVEVLVGECNRTHNAEILCKDGFYRRRARNPWEPDQCVKCLDCDKPTRSCQGYHNTVCCGRFYYEAVLNKDGFYVCSEGQVRCRQGQYFKAIAEDCLPCPSNTFMSQDKHRNEECVPCQTVADNTHILRQECNKTHDAIVACKEWYFRTSSTDSQLSAGECSPCRYCKIMDTPCDFDRDAVCRDESTTTTVVTKSDSIESKDNIETSADMITCGQGEYVFTDFNNKSVSCRRCRNGTYIDASNHSSTTCKNCSEFKNGQLPALCQIGYDDNSRSNLKIVYLVLTCVFLSINILSIVLIICWKLKSTIQVNRTPANVSLIFLLTFIGSILVCLSFPLHILTTSVTHVQPDSFFTSLIILLVCLFITSVVFFLLSFLIILKQNTKKYALESEVVTRDNSQLATKNEVISDQSQQLLATPM
uniref:TNFR-Cys domain-containing protein n=1 Tax=Arion vulgaris TaxID=1028688 RepID=A0A0B7B083_9EUPU